MSEPFTLTELEAYLDEALPHDRMVEIEAKMRKTPELTDQLATLAGRRDAGLHTVGAIWRRHRLTCPSREQLGGYLLGVLDPAHTEYLKFHLESVGCRYCTANLADLQEQQRETDAQAAASRRRKYFQSSAGYLSGSED